MNPSLQIKKSIKKAVDEIDKTNSLKLDDILLEHPVQEEHGDYSSNIPMSAKSEKLKLESNNPREIARKIVKVLDQDKKLFQTIDKIQVAGPGFINFYLKEEYLIELLKEALENKNEYGRNDWGKGQKWLIEHTSPNPNKAMHLGHLRNNVTGMAISNLAEFIGIKVIRDCVMNDRGIAIAKLMWGYLKFSKKDNNVRTDIQHWYEHEDKWLTPEDVKKRPDRFMDELYVKASDDFKKDKNVEEKVRQMVVAWEHEDRVIWALWKKVLSFVYKGQELTLKRLENKWDHIWYEHEHYQQGKDIVSEGLEKKIFKKSEGAVVTDLESYKLPDTVVVKKDGTSLYITQDLALTKLKKEKFNPDKMFWVIGPEQSLAMKQMFAVSEQLGTGKLEDFIHIDYGYMSIKDQGKMSSREGNVIYIDDLIDHSKNGIKKKMDRTRFKQEEFEKVAEKLALGAVKYGILKVGRRTDMAFDFKTSLSFEGDSGPYLQYTYARCKSVLGQSEVKDFPNLNDLENLNDEELQILRYIYRFPEIVSLSAQQYSPNLICEFLNTLAQRFNTFYNKHSVLKAEDEDVKKFRLALTQAVAQVLKNGLGLLGIEVAERV